jgi:regulatory protein
MRVTATELKLPSTPVEALIAEPGVEGSVRIVVGGRRLFTVPIEAIRAEKLQVGSHLTAEIYERLSEAADWDAAFRALVQMLGRRPFAAKDAGRRLVKKGHPAAAAARALERAGRLGYLDDAKFVQHFVATRIQRGRGPARLQRELSLMGVDRRLIDDAIATYFPDPESVGVAAERLARRRLAQLKGLDRRAARRRLLMFLARRGYVGEGVRRLVYRLVGDVG